MTVATVVVIVVAAALVASLWLSYNRLVRLRNRAESSWAQIDVQLTQRADLIPNLVETVKGYASHERETLEATVAARNAVRAASGPADAAAADTMLTGALRQVFALSEAYPQLQANASFLALQEQLTATESKLSYARQLYNEVVRSYNDARQTFPTVLVARMFGFGAREYFALEAGSAKRDVPAVHF